MVPLDIPNVLRVIDLFVPTDGSETLPSPLIVSVSPPAVLTVSIWLAKTVPVPSYTFSPLILRFRRVIAKLVVPIV